MSKLSAITIFTLILLHPCSELCAQIVFQKSYGGIGEDEGYGAQQTTDGGYVIAGMSTSISGMGDFYLAKTDESGDLIWAYTYGTGIFESATSVCQTSDKGFIIAGYQSSQAGGTYDGCIVKTDSTGALQWSKVIWGPSNDEIYSVKQTFDGGYILTGWTFSFVAGGNNDLFLIKTNSNGNVEWSKVIGGGGMDYGNCVKQTADSGYIISCHLMAGGGSDQAALIKTDAAGKILWAKSYLNTSGEEIQGGSSVDQTLDGGYIISGALRQPGTLFFGDALLIRTDAFGNLKWAKSYQGMWQDWFTSVSQSSDGGFIAAGGSNGFGAVNCDIFVVKTDSSGEISWSKVYGKTWDHRAAYVQQTADGGYAIAGYTKASPSENKDFYLVKTNSNGYSGCRESDATPFVTDLAVQVFNTILYDSSGFADSIPNTVVYAVGMETNMCSLVSTGEEIKYIPDIIFPTYSTGELNLKSNFSEPVQLLLYNAFGERISEINLLPGNNIKDIFALPNGIYFYSIITKNQFLQAGKFILAK